MSTFAISVQNSIESLSHSNQTRKRSKRHPNLKGGNKNIIDVDDIIVYTENPINSTKKLLDLISKFGKTSGFKVNIQKSKAFSYTSNEKSETEIRKKIFLV